LHQANLKDLKHPKLVQLFDRYATYNGSNPYKTRDYGDYPSLRI
jgi:hypothetical protein